MNADNIVPTASGAAWELVAQVLLPGAAGDKDRAARLAVEALRDLALPSAQLPLVYDAVADVAQQIDVALPISFSLFVAGGPAHHAPPTSEPVERRGWGCFVVKRLVAEAPAAEAGAHYRVDVFLYPEGT